MGSWLGLGAKNWEVGVEQVSPLHLSSFVVGSRVGVLFDSNFLVVTTVFLLFQVLV